MKLITALFTVFFLSTLTVSAAQVRDVPSGHWAKGDVDKLVNEYGFMQGDPNGYFGGNRALSRYEFAKTISRLVEYYNGEIDSDRKDIESMVSIMELFQKEIKSLETKLNVVSQNVQEQNQIISEINDIAVTIGDEYQEQNSTSAQTQRAIMESRIVDLETNIDKLQNKGLFVDTLVKGTYNDIKKLGKATARVVSGSRRNVGGPQVRYQEPEPVQAQFKEMTEEYIEQVEPVLEQPVDPYDSMAPAGADKIYNPYDVEIMDDIGR